MFDWRKWAEDLCGGQIGFADYQVTGMADEDLAKQIQTWGEEGWADYNRLFQSVHEGRGRPVGQLLLTRPRSGTSILIPRFRRSKTP